MCVRVCVLIECGREVMVQSEYVCASACVC